MALLVQGQERKKELEKYLTANQYIFEVTESGEENWIFRIDN